MKNNMRYLISVFLVLSLVVGLGAGCKQGDDIPPTSPAEEVAGWDNFSNAEFGYAFQYPGIYNVNRKPQDQRTTYLGEDVRFIMSVNDPTQGEKVENIFYLYYFENIDLDQFKEVLLASYRDDENPEFVSEEVVNQGGLVLTRLENTTAIDTNKVHYIREDEAGLLVFSVFLFELEAFEEMLKTFQVVEDSEE